MRKDIDSGSFVLTDKQGSRLDVKFEVYDLGMPPNIANVYAPHIEKDPSNSKLTLARITLHRWQFEFRYELERGLLPEFHEFIWNCLVGRLARVCGERDQAERVQLEQALAYLRCIMFAPIERQSNTSS